MNVNNINFKGTRVVSGTKAEHAELRNLILNQAISSEKHKKPLQKFPFDTLILKEVPDSDVYTILYTTGEDTNKLYQFMAKAKKEGFKPGTTAYEYFRKGEIREFIDIPHIVDKASSVINSIKYKVIDVSTLALKNVH